MRLVENRAPHVTLLDVEGWDGDRSAIGVSIIQPERESRVILALEKGVTLGGRTRRSPEYQNFGREHVDRFRPLVEHCASHGDNTLLRF